MKDKRDFSMKPNPIFVAAAGFAMLGACSVATQDENGAETVDSNSTSALDENLITDQNAAGTDTLGNQLNQLNESDAAAANEAANSTD